jgi:hypothetical protein
MEGSACFKVRSQNLPGGTEGRTMMSRYWVEIRTRISRTWRCTNHSTQNFLYVTSKEHIKLVPLPKHHDMKPNTGKSRQSSTHSGTGWGWVVRFILRQLYLKKRAPWCHWKAVWVCPRAGQSKRGDKRKFPSAGLHQNWFTAVWYNSSCT